MKSPTLEPTGTSPLAPTITGVTRDLNDLCRESEFTALRSVLEIYAAVLAEGVS